MGEGLTVSFGPLGLRITGSEEDDFRAQSSHDAAERYPHLWPGLVSHSLSGAEESRNLRAGARSNTGQRSERGVVR